MEPESRAPAASSSQRFNLWTVLLITGITYLGVVRFGFVYDDDPQILLNPFIKTWGYLPQYFRNSVWKHFDPNVHVSYYRPIFLLWARLNYAVFDIRPLGWHVTTILLHLLVTWLVYLVICRITGRMQLAWLTALIFGVHPIHHEVVAWVSGTTESLFAALFLLSFLSYLRARESANKAWMFVSYGCYALALFAKETAIVLPGLIFAHTWLTNDTGNAEPNSGTMHRMKQAFGQISFYFPIAIVYLMMRYKALSGLSPGQQSVTVPMWLLTLPSMS